ncbi:MAG: DEAD/DEAH box helicase [Pseudomonadota bacterium]
MDFKKLGVSSPLTKALIRADITKPTPIQTQAIPLALEGRDILGLAQTGTGKTLAFGVPLVDHLLSANEKPQHKTVKALILAPTRELVNQISDNLKVLTFSTPIKVLSVMGGQSLVRQTNQLQRGAHVLVATPGRLIDLMERGAVKLGHVQYLVLDEADQMLDMGFIHALRQIEPRLGTPRQTMLFSATMPKLMEELSRSYLRNPKKVQVSPPGKAADKIRQSVHFLTQDEKLDRLTEILSQDLAALSLVFGRTKRGVNRLCESLVKRGFNAVAIHGNKSQGQRDRAIKSFKDGAVKILVATDVAARGIDIPGVAYVINYDFPEVAENYVHRIGRTARAGRAGKAITLCTSDDVSMLKSIQRLLKTEIPVESGQMPQATKAKKVVRGPRRSKPNQSGAKPKKGAKPYSKKRPRFKTSKK